MSGTRNQTTALILLTALSLSVGWGIRGNFGHEYGAMIPGALATMAAVLLSGRRDWWWRIPYFGFFGALGWSFGGSISYMQVIAYTHSGHSLSVLYGFACLFVIGFLWAAMGGAGAGLVATLELKRLAEFFIPLTVVFSAWVLQDFIVQFVEPRDSQFRQASFLYWYDTDWLAALVAICAVLLLAIIRRRLDEASRLVLYMAGGWWAGFLLLVVALGLRMTPPRGDNWAGCLGMTAGMWIYFWKQGWTQVTVASLITGFIGGFGFAGATLLKLVEVRSGWQTNWHSILEQTYGLINGIGVALAVLFLAKSTEPLADPPRPRSWTRLYAVFFVLLVITYVNLRKNPEVWVHAKAFPDPLYGLSADTWFNLAYLTLGLMMAAVFSLKRGQRIPMIPESALGQGQLLYVVFLWWMIIGNFERALVNFAPQRIVTEGVIYFNGALCTFLALTWAGSERRREAISPARLTSIKNQVLMMGALAAVLSICADWAIVRQLYGNQFAGQAALNIRFGPRATATKEKPSATQPHP